MSRPQYPPWVVLHIPHDSTVVPARVREQFLLNDSALTLELQRMTDHFTNLLFAEPPGDAVVVRAPVSRLVVDVERFEDDSGEPMAARGMGAVYNVTSHLAPLRRQLSPAEREALVRLWYHPHHERLEAAVAFAVERHGRCLVIDGHSFPVGECWSQKSSDDAHNQIFISPMQVDAVGVLDTLLHELIHAIDDCEHKHGKAFKKIAVKLGMVGPMRSACAGPKLKAKLHDLAHALGPYPHAALRMSTAKRASRPRPRARCPQCDYQVPMLKKFLEWGPPLCPQHRLPMVPLGDWGDVDVNEFSAKVGEV